jgi:hypothetical protein
MRFLECGEALRIRPFSLTDVYVFREKTPYIVTKQLRGAALPLLASRMEVNGVRGMSSTFNSSLSQTT